MTETGKISDLMVYFVSEREEKKIFLILSYLKMGRELAAREQKKLKQNIEHRRFEIFHFSLKKKKNISSMLETGENTWLVRYYDTMKMTVFRDRIGRRKKINNKKKHKRKQKTQKMAFFRLFGSTFGVQKKEII